MAQFTVELKGLRFFAAHGMYAEEMKVGNDFEVDLSLRSKSPATRIASISDTVNYVEVYRILQEVFSERRQLLETLAIDISEALHQRFPQLQKIHISIRKMNPPITNFSGSVGITYTRRFK